MSLSTPPVSIVIIGLNVAKTLFQCISSVKAQNYPQNLLEIIYVDGGSHDQSVFIAKSFDQVKVIELKDPKPSASKGRNAGWRVAKNHLIQFLDGDMQIEENWLKKAIPLFKEDTAAIIGQIKEEKPDKNLFHKIANIDWFIPAGKSLYFGGSTLIQKKALEITGGYDESLIAGEDPELAFRTRKKGYHILCLEDRMVFHDIQMDTLSQYIKRNIRTGHAYAEMGFRYRHEQELEKMWLKKLCMVSLSALLPFVFLISGYLSDYTLLGAIVAILFALRPLRRIFQYMQKHAFSLSQAILYSLHLSILHYLELIGAIQYFYKQLIINK